MLFSRTDQHFEDLVNLFKELHCKNSKKSHLKHDELSTSCVVIGDFNIKVKKSMTLGDYMKNTCNIYKWVKSAITHKRTLLI